MESEPGSLAEYFDGWYADMTGSPAKDEIQQRHRGLPPAVGCRAEPGDLGEFNECVTSPKRARTGDFRWASRGRFTPAIGIPTSTAARTPCPAGPDAQPAEARRRVSQLPMTAAAPAAMISAPEQRNVGAHGSQMLHGRHAPSASDANLPLTASVPGPGGSAGKNGPSAGKNGPPTG